MTVKNIFSFLMLVLFCKVLPAFAAESDDIATFPKNASIQECLKVYQSDDVQSAPTAYRRELNTKAENCFKRAMNKTLDQRLLKLKTENTKNFSLEMDLQKTFNASVGQYCGRWEDYYNKCQSTSSFTDLTECKIDFYTFREAQAAQMNSKSLSLPTEKNHSQAIEGFSDYAKKLCVLPEVGWKDQKAPDNCVDRLLAQMQKAIRDDGKKLVCGD